MDRRVDRKVYKMSTYITLTSSILVILNTASCILRVMFLVLSMYILVVFFVVIIFATLVTTMIRLTLSLSIILLACRHFKHFYISESGPHIRSSAASAKKGITSVTH